MVDIIEWIMIDDELTQVKGRNRKKENTKLKSIRYYDGIKSKMMWESEHTNINQR
jgi:hypothetical protein